MIARPEIRQLKERITYSFQLSPFKTADIKEYLNARLRACGYRLGEAFSPGAVKQIARYSNGLLRRINILADKSLLAAYADNTNKVTVKQVRTAARDSEFIGSWQRFKPALLAAVLVLILAIILLVLPIDSIKQNLQQFLSGSDARTDVVNEVAESSRAVDDDIDKQETIAEPVVIDLDAALDMKISNTQFTEQPIDESSRVTKELSFNVSPIGADQQTFMDFEQGGKISETVDTQEEVENVVMHDEAAASNQLLALDTLIQQQDFGNRKFSESDVRLLLRQLERLPAEMMMHGEAAKEASCENCASIIYRPLYEEKNL